MPDAPSPGSERLELAPATPIPIWFGDPPQLGLLHVPSGARCRSTAVVVVPPLGYEALCARASLCRLAERCAQEGFFVLRYDHPGTGDSAGDDREPGRVRTWLGGVSRAIAAARSHSPAERVALVGLRMGALLALAATEARNDVEALVLWAPPPSGRAYARELRALAGFSDGFVSRNPDDHAGVAGFFFAEDTLAELAEIDGRRFRSSAAGSLLVALPEDIARCEKSLQLDKVELMPVAGATGALLDPHEAGVPQALLDGVADWLSTRLPETTDTRVGPVPSPRIEVTRVTGRPRVVEEAVRFGPQSRLFGVLSEPLVPDHACCVVFLNAGAIFHVGMNRNYVTLARALAERGMTSLRFDVSGLGDSMSREGADGALLYSPGVVQDVGAALDFLEIERRYARFVLVGLCAGAYAAFHAARADRRVAGAVMINPQTFDYKPGDPLDVRFQRSLKSARWYRRSMFHKESWQKALRGEVDFLRVASLLLGRLGQAVRAKLAAARRPKSPPSLSRAFEELCERGTRLLLMYSSDDPGRDHLREALRGDLTRLLRRPELELQIIDGADHTFTPLTSQRVLEERLVSHILNAHGECADGSFRCGDDAAAPPSRFRSPRRAPRARANGCG